MADHAKFVATARRVITQEAEALTVLADQLGDSFAAAVDLLLGAPGRVIVSGMGKSGHIARKIAATFASTGTPAHFVHPAEASHGDLGMMTRGDVVLVLSNSGETPELADLVAYTRRFGISTFSIADAIRTAVYGKEVSKFKQGEDEYDIYVRLQERYRYDVDNLLNQKVTFQNPSNGRIVQVPISAVASVKYTSTYSSIKRKNLDRVITIYSNVLADYNANEIVAELQDIMAEYPMPRGYFYEFTGEQQQQAEDTAFLLGAFLVVIFSIFLILVAQFNSISSPFIIILSVVFSTIGVFLGYYFTGRNIALISTGIGVISLAGIVVNNAIVLIDYINLLLKRKMDEMGVSRMSDFPLADAKTAIVEAGGTRLRPVLLTAITTVLGLVPLAIGLNINFFTIITDLDPNYVLGGDNTAFWGPMAWTVIYGLTYATFLTLVVVPVMYWLIYRFKLALSRLFRRDDRPPLDARIEPAE